DQDHNSSRPMQQQPNGLQQLQQTSNLHYTRCPSLNPIQIGTWTPEQRPT
ncbi:hypothetical protein A2U01_0070845, partial [Trifolium medium]|nr:hypothetical protein [Trifolium medium]